MKNKTFLLFILIIVLISGIFIFSYHFKTPQTVLQNKDVLININVNDIKISKLYLENKLLAKEFEKIGYSTELSDKNNFKSGHFNLYVTNSAQNCPDVLDPDAINILWLPHLSEKNHFEKFRAFDVIVVKSMSAFNFLKAINVRTAYIPDAINLSARTIQYPKKKLMFWGDNQGFSLSLFLAGKYNFSVDVFGQGFQDVWPKEEIKESTPSRQDIENYYLVLVDQTDEFIRDELIEDKIIEIIENGAVPFTRFNSAIYKIFGESLPMYMNEEDFVQNLRFLRNSPEHIMKIKQDLIKISQNWNTNSVAQKFSELFTVMRKKRINK